MGEFIAQPAAGTPPPQDPVRQFEKSLYPPPPQRLDTLIRDGDAHRKMSDAIEKISINFSCGFE
jgi:hypothetical protein